MRVLVISNDVTPGFGVPVAAPGIRAAGLVDGLRAHGHDVEMTVPKPILDRVWNRPTPPSPPAGVRIVDPTDLRGLIEQRRPDVVVFTNANMIPHLGPVEGVRFVFDLFAPKILELLSSGRTDRDWADDAARKERAMALADHVWVNGRRKLGYALGWLLRPSVQRIRTEQMGKPALIDGDPMRHLSLVEMPVPFPNGIGLPEASAPRSGPLRIGNAGYAQAWSVLSTEEPTQQLPLSLGHELHVLAPTHWGGATEGTAAPLPKGVIAHEGPLDYPSFARWIQSMDVIADYFEQSAERHMAMITRSAVALRFGVPIIHGVDSEISDMVREADAGWVVEPGDVAGWTAAINAAADPAELARKREGAHQLATERFAPAAALAEAAARLP